jgi:transposase
LGLPVDFAVTAGQIHDCTQAIGLLAQRKAEAVLADKGYDSNAIVQHIVGMGATAVIPPKRNRKQQREFDKMLYKQRNRIEPAVAVAGNSTQASAADVASVVGAACSWALGWDCSRDDRMLWRKRNSSGGDDTHRSELYSCRYSQGCNDRSTEFYQLHPYRAIKAGGQRGVFQRCPPLPTSTAHG